MPVLSSSGVYTLYVLAFALAALTCFASVTRLRRVTDAETRRGLLALVLTSGGWATAHVGFFLSPTRTLKLGWYTLGLVLGLAAVGAWLYFCSAYTNRTYHRDPRYRRLAVGVFLALVAIKVTNPLHHGYFTTTAVAAPFPHLSVATGPLHWTAMGLSYALALVGYFMLLELFTEIDFDTRPLVVLVGITGLPVVADLVGYATPLLIDITYEPIGVAVFAVGVTSVYLDQFNTVRLATEEDSPLIALDAEGRIRDTNRAARTLFPNLAAATGEQLDDALPSVAERLGSETPILKVQQEGEPRYFRLTETPYGTTKRGLGSTLSFTDVTERERAKQEVERQNERLEKFASLVSHDLRNPLNVAQTRLELLRADVEPDNEHVPPIDRSLTRIETLIEEILTLARTGQQVQQWDEVLLSSAVTECWEMVETGDATLTVDTDVTFRADPERLKRVFENLFRNAVDHGDAEVTITVGALADRSGFYVADDGPGIPTDERERVFEAGYTTGEGTTGFGLAIVADIVAAHGWEIRVAESATGGARFEITGVTLAESATGD